VAGGGTTASGGTIAGAKSAAPWAPVAAGLALVALVAGGFLWWRRRTPAYADPSAATAVSDAPVAPRPAHAAAGTSPSVVVSGGRHRSDAPAVAEPASTVPVPQPVADPVVDPVEAAPVATGPLLEAPVAVEPEAAVEPPAVEPSAVEPSAVEPSAGGHVRIITPPGRAPEA
jgi:hypothetical protein